MRWNDMRWIDSFHGACAPVKGTVRPSAKCQQGDSNNSMNSNSSMSK